MQAVDFHSERWVAEVVCIFGSGFGESGIRSLTQAGAAAPGSATDSLPPRR